MKTYIDDKGNQYRMRQVSVYGWEMEIKRPGRRWTYWHNGASVYARDNAEATLDSYAEYHGWREQEEEG